MKSRLFVLIAFALLASLVLSACARPLGSGDEGEPSPTEEPTQAPTEDPDQPVTEEPATTEEPTMPPAPGEGQGVLYVSSVDALVMESFPVQVNALVRGDLADGCTTVGEVTVEGPQNNTFNITIKANRDPDMMCTQALVPFEHTVSLPVRDLPAGTYTVIVNGEAQTTFELAVDNTSGDSGGQTEDLASLIAALEAQGMVVEEGDTLEQDFFAVGAQIIKVAGEDVQVFEFDDAAAAEAAAASISGAGSMITLPDGSVIQVDWISAPHWFQSGRLVVLYVGNTADILAALTAALGPELFAE